MSPSKLVILDGSLVNTEGHHYEYARAVSNAAKERGLDVVVLANTHLSQTVKIDLNALPIFEMRIYDSIFELRWFPTLRDRINGLAYAIRFAYDWFRKGASKYVDASTLVFIPTCTPAMGLSLALLLRCGSLRRAKTVCLFRFDPKPMMTFAVRLLRSLVRGEVLSLATDSELLAEVYRKHTNLDYRVLPVPHTPNPLLIEGGQRRRSGPLKIAFVGDARLEKGIDVLARTIPSLDAELRSGVIVLSIQCSVFMPEPGVLSVVQSLGKLTQAYDGGLVLLNEPLASREYYKLLMDSDILIMPYRENNYRYRTSGILVEALCLGKKVVVTSNTWMCKQVERYGSGSSFRDGDPVDLANAIKRVIRQYDQSDGDASAKALEWKKFHNASTILELLMPVTVPDKSAK